MHTEVHPVYIGSSSPQLSGIKNLVLFASPLPIGYLL